MRQTYRRINHPKIKAVIRDARIAKPIPKYSKAAMINVKINRCCKFKMQILRTEIGYFYITYGDSRLC